MQSRDSCLQRETSSSMTLLPTGTIKVQVKSCAWQVIYIFLLNQVSSDEYFRLRKEPIVMEVPRSSFNQKLENYVGKHTHFES